ncbi:MAG TPA: response regulator transcription factor, partial [Propionibacteriaceae bacterium]|nr:response regulator transcription factor [Propionibacteriaceae bacterium]
MAISVVLAEDSVLVREGMRAVLNGADDIEVAAACVDGAELRRAIIEHTPDVVVTDIRMPPGLSDEGIQIAQELRRDHPQVGVVVVSSA